MVHYHTDLKIQIYTYIYSSRITSISIFGAFGGLMYFYFMCMSVGNQTEFLTISPPHLFLVLFFFSVDCILCDIFPCVCQDTCTVRLRQPAVFVLLFLVKSQSHSFGWRLLPLPSLLQGCCWKGLVSALCSLQRLPALYSARPQRRGLLSGFLCCLLIIDIHWASVRIWRRLFPCVSPVGVPGFSAACFDVADVEPWRNQSHLSIRSFPPILPRFTLRRKLQIV